MNRALQITGALAASLAIVIAGCSGGGTNAGSSALPGMPAKPAAKGSIAFSIRIPEKQPALAKRPNYVSPDTGSIAFTVAGQSSIIVLSPLASNPNCTLSGSTYTCTAVQANIPAGNDQITIATYQSTTPTVGTDTPLSTETVTETIVADQSNPETFTLNGVVNSFSMAYNSTLLPMGTSGSVTATFTPVDAAGDTIVLTNGATLVDSSGNMLTPTLTDSDTSGDTGITGNSSSGYTISYNGATMAPPTLTMTVGSLPVQTQTIELNAISNGFFTASGNPSFAGWSACSFAHTAEAITNASPTPAVASPEPTATVAALTNPSAAPSPTTSPLNPSPGPTQSAAPYIVLATPPANYADAAQNPTGAAATPPPTLGSNVVLIGNTQAEIKGVAGICQTIAVPAVAEQLRFWVYEGGTQFSFASADQEADILDSTGTTLQQTLFSELNCLWDPNVIGGQNYAASTSGCIPVADGGTGSFPDEDNGGYWKQQGPYNLSAYAGTTVTLFIGVWDNFTDKYPNPKDGNAMWVGNVTLTNS